MKKFKKIIFLACFVMLIAVMAIAASAYDTSTDRKVEVTLPTGVTTVNNEAVSGTIVSLSLYDARGNALTWYVNGTDLTSITTKSILSVSSGELIFSDSNYIANIVVLNMQDSDIDAQGENKFGHGNNYFKGKTNLQCVYFADSTTTFSGTNTFNGCSNLNYIDFSDNSKLKVINDNTFINCPLLKSVSVPPLVTSFGTAFKNNTGLESITFKGSLFEEIANKAFNGCTALKEINIPNGVERIGNQAFMQCSSLETITLPNSVETIGYDAFKTCTSLTYINLGASVKTFELNGTTSNAFNLNGNTKAKIFIIPGSNVTEESVVAVNAMFRQLPGPVKFFFTGTKSQLDIFMSGLGSEDTIFTNIADENILEYDLDKGYDYYTKLDGTYIIYNYNKCEAFYSGKHIESDAVLAYADGFDKSGTSTCTCIRECGYSKSTAIAPIFAALGYSIKGTNDAIYGGFTVNAEALKNYNDYITAQGENALRYGIVIVNMGTSVADGTNLAFTSAGVVDSTKAIQVEINDTNFARFGFTLTGFGDDTKGLNLVISAYVIESKTDAETDTTTVKNVSFVQQEAKNVDGTGIDGYYTAMVIANSSETKKLGTMTLTRLLALTGKGVVTEDTITTGTTNGESASGGGTEVIE